jgi:hypothetical protein
VQYFDPTGMIFKTFVESQKVMLHAKWERFLRISFLNSIYRLKSLFHIQIYVTKLTKGGSIFDPNGHDLSGWITY